MKTTLLMVAMLSLSVVVLAPAATASETCTITPVAAGVEIVTCGNGDVPTYVCIRLPHGECYEP